MDFGASSVYWHWPHNPPQDDFKMTEQLSHEEISPEQAIGFPFIIQAVGSQAESLTVT